MVCSVILTLCESVNQYRGHLKPVETGGLVLDNKNVILDWEKITVAGKEAGKVECFLERGERSSLLRCDRMVIIFVSDGMVFLFGSDRMLIFFVSDRMVIFFFMGKYL